MKIYGHSDVRLMNGGRKKWLSEGRELTTDVPSVQPAKYKSAERRPLTNMMRSTVD